MKISYEFKGISKDDEEKYYLKFWEGNKLEIESKQVINLLIGKEFKQLPLCNDNQVMDLFTMITAMGYDNFELHISG